MLKKRICSLIESDKVEGKKILPKDSHLIKMLSLFETLELLLVSFPRYMPCFPMAIFSKGGWRKIYGYKLLDIYVLQVHTSVAPTKMDIIQQLI